MQDETMIEKRKAIGLRLVKQLMEFWSITPQDIRRAAKAGPPMVKTAPAEPAVKYRHPVSGLTWDGCGTQPDWLRQALLAEGRTVAELLPANQTADVDADAGADREG